MASPAMDVGAALHALQAAISTREHEAQRSASVWRSMYEEQRELAERLQSQVRALESAAKADSAPASTWTSTTSPPPISQTLAIPKSPNKPHGPGSSPKSARAVALSRSPSIQELLLAEDDEDDGGGGSTHQRAHQRTSVRSHVNSSSKESFTTSPSKEGLKGLRWQEIQSCVQSAGVGAAAAAAIATAGARAWVGVAASNGSIQSNGNGSAVDGRHGPTKKVGFKLICHAPLMPDNGLLDDDPSDTADTVLEVRNGGGLQRARRPTLHDFVEVESKGATDSGASLTAGHSSERLSELMGSMHCTYRSLTVAMGSDVSIPMAGSSGDHVGRKPPRVPGRRDSIGEADGIGLVGADVEALSCSPGSEFGVAEPPMTSTVDDNRTLPNAESSGNAIELRWTEPPTTVLVVCKPNGGPALETALETALEILVRQERIQVWVEPSVKQELPRLTNTLHTWDPLPFTAEHDAINKPPEWLVSKLDLVVTLGGDGTVLWVSNLLGHGPMPPVAAVALGSLGFMTPLPADNLVCCLRGVLRGGFMLTLRHRLHCRIVRNGEHRGQSFDSLPLATAARAEEWVVMNECTVDRGVSPFLTSLKAYCNDTFITDVQGDGLIVSTPSGSTAYSLAAGGSMVHPQVPCFLFTPICPHSLSFRPLVFPDSVKLRLTVPGDSRATMWASFDGKGRTQLNAGDSVVIRLSPWPMPTICLKDDTGDWFRSVRHNLHFNLRQQQGGATS